jgi:hypothetical protein
MPGLSLPSFRRWDPRFGGPRRSRPSPGSWRGAFAGLEHHHHLSSSSAATSCSSLSPALRASDSRSSPPRTWFPSRDVSSAPCGIRYEPLGSFNRTSRTSLSCRRVSGRAKFPIAPAELGGLASVAAKPTSTPASGNWSNRAASSAPLRNASALPSGSTCPLPSSRPLRTRFGAVSQASLGRAQQPGTTKNRSGKPNTTEPWLSAGPFWQTSALPFRYKSRRLRYACLT